MEEFKNFKKFLKKNINNKSFCVVGNSPIEIGAKNGKKINSFDSVIRFNDYSLNYKKDYGTKVDIWVRATNDFVIETLSEKNKINHKITLFRTFHEKNKKSTLFLSRNGGQYTSFPPRYERNLSKILKAIPSIGLLFLYILKLNNFKISQENVYGFSFFDKNDIVKYNNHHYYNAYTNKMAIGIATAKHDWVKEKKFFKDFILE